MKKILFAVLMSTALAGCGNMGLGCEFTFDEAVTKWPDGTVKTIPIKQWCDCEGEQIQVIAKDGTTYLLSMNNTVLIHRSKFHRSK